MAVVSCPECSKKLKVADTSVGKKVKCSCGTIFVAEIEADAPAPAVKKVVAAVPSATGALTAEKVLVSCTECLAKLKVATTSLGKKMKCPKCTAIFVASLAEAAMPVKKAVKTAPPGDDFDEDFAPKAKVKTKPAQDDAEMDDLLGFAQAEVKTAPKGNYRDDDDDSGFDDDEPVAPKGKSSKGKPVPSRRDDDEGDDDEPRVRPASDAKPVYPSRLLVNIFVFLLVIAYFAFFAVIYFDIVKMADLGLGKVKHNHVVPVETKGKDTQPTTGKAGKNKGGMKKEPTKVEEKIDEPKKIDEDKKVEPKKEEEDKKVEPKKDEEDKDDGKKIELKKDVKDKKTDAKKKDADEDKDDPKKKDADKSKDDETRLEMRREERYAVFAVVNAEVHASTVFQPRSRWLSRIA